MNRERYYRVLEQIVNHPDTWRQTAWHCGTQHCFAGWAQLIATGRENDSQVKVFSDGSMVNYWEFSQGREYDLECVTFLDAMKYLELTQAEAQYVFNSKRTLDELVDFYENYPTADTDRVSDCVTGAVSSEDTGTACISDNQQDLSSVR